MAVRSLQERTTPGPSGGGEGEKTPHVEGAGEAGAGTAGGGGGAPPQSCREGRGLGAPGLHRVQRRLWPGGALGARGLRRAPIAEQECGHREVGLRASGQPQGERRASECAWCVRETCATCVTCACDVRCVRLLSMMRVTYAV